MDRIDLMRTYLSVADTGSFVGAAKRLDMTPQLVSKYIRALEDELGSQLFHRSTRKVSMTDTGAAFYDRCARLIHDFEELKADVQQNHRNPTGELKVTAPQCFGGKYIVDALADFTVDYPDISINLEMTDRYLDLLEEGIDIAVRIGELADSSLIARQIAQTQIVYCASPDYLGKHRVIQTPADLENHDCIIDTNYRAQSKWPFEIDGEERSFDVSGRFRVNSAAGARKLALQGRGVTLTLMYMVREDIKAGTLSSVLADYSNTTLPINVVYPPTKHLSAKVRAFINFAADRFRAAL